jgi:hypothetical protein
LRAGFFILISIIGIITAELKGNDNHPAGSNAAAMGNAAVVSRGFWSLFHNQAGLAALERITFGIHHENKFSVPEFALHAIGAAVPTKPGTIGVNITYFGFSKYNEIKTGLSFGRQFGNNLSAGIQLNYLHTHISDHYGNTSNLTVEGGFIASPLENFFIGAHIFNPVRTTIKTWYNQPIPTILKFGLGYHFGDRAIVHIETEKDLDKKALFKAGSEITVVENFVLRTGISGMPLQSSFGLGYLFRGFQADLAFTNHYILGLTPHISITYSLP